MPSTGTSRQDAATTTALIALDERGGRRALTYRELLAEVERVAAGLRGLGIGPRATA